MIDISPSFVIAIIIYALAGNLKVAFLAYTCAFIHEIAHIIAARFFGYKVKVITFFAGGFNVKFFDFKDISCFRESIIAASGPFVNLIILIVASLFKIENDLLFKVNIYLFAVNLLPVFPLDGGRIVRAFLKAEFSVDKANKILNIISLLTAVVTVATVLFFTVLDEISISFLVISVYILSNISLEKNTENKFDCCEPQNVKCFLCNGEVTLGNLIYKTGINNNVIVFITENDGSISGYITGHIIESAAMNDFYGTSVKSLSHQFTFGGKINGNGNAG